MKFDGTIDIATGMSARSKTWKNKKILWSELVQRLSQELKTNETYKEYISATKEEQGKIKDVGGYVGGYLRNGRRKPENVVHRQILTLDIDFAHSDFWEDFEFLYDNAAVLHATHKHHETSPRLRLVMPLSREATPDEYVAVARRVAGSLGIDMFDNTTFETNRLMFWPSNPKDVDYYFRYQDGPWVDVDATLKSYVNWKDSSEWPTAEAHHQKIKTAAQKQEDPENKKGIVGAFCRTYTIQEAIAKFLPDVYREEGDDRYTYIEGTTSLGMIVYEDKFAYSHHGTDPSNGKLCNAFDLVRIHKFGHEDNGTYGKDSKSYKLMVDFAREDPEVRRVVAADRMESVSYDFAEDWEDPEEEEDNSWMDKLDIDKQGRILSTAPNLTLIFANDIRLKGLFRNNSFDQKRYVFGSLPWRRTSGIEPLKDVDYSGVRNYIETIYGITGVQKIEDALALEFEKNSFHPVQDYLKNLKWDGVKRVDEVLIKYFGAEDSQYTREAMRKFMVGAVARVFKPGVKFDLVLTLVSKQQGTGKSSFFKALGREWFSDTFLTVQGKDGLESIQGSWIIEMAELSAMRKAEVETVKHFLTKQEDTFRAAYARTSSTYKRQCVFVATTNETTFLKDTTGNRRFMPVTVHATELVDNDPLRELLEDDQAIGQLWAEAVQLYKQGEPLYLGKLANSEAHSTQKNHMEQDERKGIIEEYLDTLLPENWREMDLDERRNFLTDPLAPEGTVTRDFVCIAEIWCECLLRDKEDMDKYKTRELNDIMKTIDGWEYNPSTKRFPGYGIQRYYERDILG